MNILILGKGGREHALVHALTHSPLVNQIYVLPGSHGIESQAICLFNTPLEKSKLKDLISSKNIQLVIIGPEQELAQGWADYFRELNVLVFGPSKQAARLESSKIFAKHFMSSAGISTPEFTTVSSLKEVLAAAPNFGFPVVLKADGLAGGKGVFICHNQKELEQSARLLFEQKIFSQAGERALLEKFQKGSELSVFVLTNGHDYKIFPFAKDYKKLKNKNQGPNTGGMGAFAPHIISPELQDTIQKTIVHPSIKELQNSDLFDYKKEHKIYRGILYIGLMIVNKKPLVLEYNVRFGDPETQVLLPLLDGDWLKVFMSVAQGQLPELKWKNNCFASCVVLASKNYPNQNIKKSSIQGEIGFQSPHSYFLHAGTQKNNNKWHTHGGRVLNAVGIGVSKSESLKQAYMQAQSVNWNGMQMRSDIGD